VTASARILDPIDRVSEVLFGLIMVLTFTGSLSIAEAGRDDVRTMLIGALGCNVAWGIIVQCHRHRDVVSHGLRLRTPDRASPVAGGSVDGRARVPARRHDHGIGRIAVRRLVYVAMAIALMDQAVFAQAPPNVPVAAATTPKLTVTGNLFNPDQDKPTFVLAVAVTC
jgi:hypothetical protein